MSEQEPQFNIPEEKLRKMRAEHERVEEAAERGETTPISEVVSQIEKETEEKRKPLEPSRGTQFLIDGEGGIFPEKQRELLATTAYFQERMINGVFAILRGERTSAGAGREDIEEVEKALRDLSAKYEDILEPTEEYPAAREMLRDLEDYLLNLKEHSDTESQPITAVWHNLSKRIENFHTAFLLKDAKSIEQKQHLLRISQLIRLSILDRAPQFGPPIPKPNKAAEKAKGVIDRLSLLIEEENKLSPEEKQRLNDDIDRDFEEWGEYMDQHHHYENFPLPIPEEQAREWREEIEKLIQEKGTKEGTPSRHGKQIILEGEEIKELFGGEAVELWDPNELEGLPQKESGEAQFRFPIHISVRGLNEGLRPHYVAIKSNGEVCSAISWYDDYPSSIEDAEKTRDIPPIKWKVFVGTVLEKARAYVPPEEQSRDESEGK